MKQTSLMLSLCISLSHRTSSESPKEPKRQDSKDKPLAVSRRKKDANRHASSFGFDFQDGELR